MLARQMPTTKIRPVLPALHQLMAQTEHTPQVNELKSEVYT